jgi:hypothetical protein
MATTETPNAAVVELRDMERALRLERAHLNRHRVIRELERDIAGQRYATVVELRDMERALRLERAHLNRSRVIRELERDIAGQMRILREWISASV